MRKRFKCFLSAVMVFISIIVFCLPINAVESNLNGIEQLIKEENELCSAYTSQIEDIMQSLVREKELHNNLSTKDLRGAPDTVATFDISNAYRVYKMESLFLTKLNQTGSFEDTLTNEVQWKVPVVTQKGESGLVTLLEDNGNLSWAATEVGESSEIFYVNDVKIKNAVQKAVELKGDFEDIKIAHSYRYYTTFVYLTGAQEEYLIPFSCYSEEIGIQNGELYTVTEIQNKFNNCFDEKSFIENGDRNGGLPFKKRTSDLKVRIGLCCFFGIVTTLIFIMINKKKAQ